MLITSCVSTSIILLLCHVTSRFWALQCGPLAVRAHLQALDSLDLPAEPQLQRELAPVRDIAAMPHVEIYQFKLHAGEHRTLVVALSAYRLAKSVPPVDLAELAQKLSVVCATNATVVADSVRGATIVLDGAVGEDVLDYFRDDYVAAVSDMRLHFAPPPTKKVKKKKKKKPAVVPPLCSGPPPRAVADAQPPPPPSRPAIPDETRPIRERMRELRRSLTLKQESAPSAKACEVSGDVTVDMSEWSGGERRQQEQDEEPPPPGRSPARRTSNPPPPPPDVLGAPGRPPGTVALDAQQVPPPPYQAEEPPPRVIEF